MKLNDSRSRITNIAAYTFVAMEEEELHDLRKALKSDAANRKLLGTLLLSPEGINLSLSGTDPQIQAFWRFLTSKPKFADLDKKVSYSAVQPFKHLYVKLRKEIITMGHTDTKPENDKNHRMSPAELKKWFDEKKDFTLLDTRNDYEINIGTFKGARVLNIQSFREFPKAAVENLGKELHQKPLVMFCTGGIRCEKASLFLQSQGFRDVYQLNGGILRYFEEVGATHFQGECFVFDDRVAVNAALQPTGAVLCQNCQMPLTVEQQASSDYVPGGTCPYCRESTPHAST